MGVQPLACSWRNIKLIYVALKITNFSGFYSKIFLNIRYKMNVKVDPGTQTIETKLKNCQSLLIVPKKGVWN